MLSVVLNAAAVAMHSCCLGARIPAPEPPPPPLEGLVAHPHLLRLLLLLLPEPVLAGLLLQHNKERAAAAGQYMQLSAAGTWRVWGARMTPCKGKQGEHASVWRQGTRQHSTEAVCTSCMAAGPLTGPL